MLSYFDERAYRKQYQDFDEALRQGHLRSAEEHFWNFYPEGRNSPYKKPGSVASGKPPKISVVIPVYNHAPFLGLAIRSVLDQTYGDFELIIVNDGSTDNEVAKILWKMKEEDSRIILFSKPNGGTGSALNMGFSYARGEFATWLSADSWWEPECLESLKDCLERNPEIVMAYGDWELFVQRTGETKIKETPEYDPDFLRREYKLGPNWLWRFAQHQEVGRFVDDVCEDYDFLLRLSEFGSFKRVSKVLGSWREHPNNVSTNHCNPNGWTRASVHRAKHWWKKAPIKVAVICPTLDPAGALWRTARVINGVSNEVACRHIVGDPVPLESGSDLCIHEPIHGRELKRILDEADIIHFNHLFPDDPKVNYNFLPWLEKKPSIMHFHGEGSEWFKLKIKKWEDFGMKMVSCNPSISERVAGAVWLPNLLPLDTEGHFLEDQHLYRPARDWLLRTTPVSFMMHHNYLAGKGVLQCQEMFLFLKKHSPNGFHGKYSVWGEPRMTLRAHLTDKQQNYDVCIDQITQGFIGLAAWEALAMGIVTIGRLDHSAIREYTALGDGEMPPFINVQGIDWMAEKVLELSENRDLVSELKRSSRAWMLKHYACSKLTKIYEDMYKELLNGN